jgi:hypothetical protein
MTRGMFPTFLSIDMICRPEGAAGWKRLAERAIRKMKTRLMSLRSS